MDKDSPSNYNANSYQYSNPSSFDGFYNPQNFPQFSPPPYSSEFSNPRGFLFIQPINYPQHFYNSQQFSHSQQFPPQYYTQTEGFNPGRGFQAPQRFPSPELSAKGLDANNLNDDPDVDVEANDSTLKRTSYTSAESEVLAICWVDISVDPIVGNDQKQEQYWKRVSAAYNKNHPKKTPKRTPTILQSHWQRVQKETKRFSKCYARCCAMWPSGYSDADILNNVHEEFKVLSKNKPFKHIKVWDILKTCPKFQKVDDDCHSSKRSRTSDSGEYISSPGKDSITSEPAYARPEGQKAAKRKEKDKGKGKEKKSQPTLEAINENLSKAQQNLSEIAATMQGKTEYAILMRNTSKMNEEQLEIHTKVCEKIKKKWDMQRR